MKGHIFVNGNIIFESGHHWIKEGICCASNDYKENAIKIKTEDIFFNTKNKSSSYMPYVATGGLTCYDSGVEILYAPLDILSHFNKEIEKIKLLHAIDIPKELQSDFNRQLYIGVVGALELFLSDFLISMILGEKEYFNKFIITSKFTVKLSEIEQSCIDIQERVFDAIRSINCHQLDGEIKRIYEKTFNISFPSITNLKDKVLTRHDLVHRNGWSKSKEHSYIIITNEMLEELIIDCNEFTNSLISNMEKCINKWLSYKE